MGRNAAATFETVKAAAAVLAAKGATVSAGSIRQELGVGSNATIQKHLTRLRREEEQAPAPERMLPHELTRAIFRYADEEARRVSASLQAEAADMQQALDDLGSENQRLTEQVARQRDEIAEFKNTIAMLQGQVQQLGKDVEDARRETSAERARTEQARADLSIAQWRLKAAELSLDNATMKHQLQEIAPGPASAQPQTATRRKPRAAVDAAASVAGTAGADSEAAAPAAVVESAAREDPRQERLCE